jgi:hypothetical protein
MAFALFDEMVSNRCSRISGTDNYDIRLRRERSSTSVRVNGFGGVSPV